MSPALLLGIVVLGVVFVYARTVIRVEAPVNPAGVAIIRRRHDRCWRVVKTYCVTSSGS